ncbi:P-loop NTPase family protein [Emticicia fontis]
MKTFKEKKANIIKLFQDSVLYSRHLGYADIADEIAEAGRELAEKELTVVTAGEIKRGKSSLLTALLIEEGIFPTDTEVCTSVVTIVKYGEKELIEIVLEERKGDKVEHKSKTIKREEIASYITEDGNPNNHKRVNCLNITIPNEKLKEGFLFVDTPGLGSLNFEHARQTLAFLPSADVILFVSDTQNPLSNTEMEFIDNAWSLCKNIIFVLTKTDLKTSAETKITLEDNRAKIAQRLGIDNSEVVIVGVSNKEKLKFDKNGKTDHYDSSNFKALEDAVWKMIYDNQGAILFKPYLEKLLGGVNKSRVNVDIVDKALDSDIEAVNELGAELKSMAAEKTKLSSGAAKWKSELQHEQHIAGLEVQMTLQEKGAELNYELSELLLEDEVIYDPKKIANYINLELTKVIYEAKNSLIEKTTVTNAKISEELGLNLELNSDTLDKVRFVKKDEVNYNHLKMNGSDSIINSGRKIAGKSLSGGTIGAVAGGIIGGVVGFFVGGPAGAIMMGKVGAGYGATAGATGGTMKGIWDNVTRPKYEDVPAIRSAYSNYINQSIQSIRSSMAYSNAEITKFLIDDLDKQLKRQISQLNTISDQIEKDKKLSDTQIKDKKNKFQKLKAEIGNWRNKVLEWIKISEETPINNTQEEPQAI